MTERPITLSAPEVRAVLNGATQLRVPLDPQPKGGLCKLLGEDQGQWFDHAHNPISLPFSTGDRLWVREAWQWDYATGKAIVGRERFHPIFMIHPAKTMPIRASRITLEVTGDVRVEQDGNDWVAVAEIRRAG